MLKVTKSEEGIPEISPADLKQASIKPLMIDVREMHEFVGELGHVEGSKLVTLGEELLNFLEAQDPEKDVVFICHSGGRSARATLAALQMGYKNPMNMKGGMVLWNALGLPTKKN